ncbi:MAG: hypothetical protein RAO94_12970 [Candidatus Stygibacter australis]|nr:hypothetical protein [Candidatus Stygibacter australis]MDP8323253.1 hypothetical protein [Candidatus Stygibacter australis]
MKKKIKPGYRWIKIKSESPEDLRSVLRKMNKQRLRNFKIRWVNEPGTQTCTNLEGLSKYQKKLIKYYMRLKKSNDRTASGLDFTMKYGWLVKPVFCNWICKFREICKIKEIIDNDQGEL